MTMSSDISHLISTPKLLKFLCVKFTLVKNKKLKKISNLKIVRSHGEQKLPVDFFYARFFKMSEDKS